MLEDGCSAAGQMRVRATGPPLAGTRVSVGDRSEPPLIRTKGELFSRIAMISLRKPERSGWGSLDHSFDQR